MDENYTQLSCCEYIKGVLTVTISLEYDLPMAPRPGIELLGLVSVVAATIPVVGIIGICLEGCGGGGGGKVPPG